MSNIRYHTVQPENNKSQYNEFDTVSWLLVSDGRKLMKNSIRIEADLEVFSTGTTRKANTADVKVNNLIGAHAFFESWSCETESAGTLQNLASYPRYVNMVASSTLDSDDLNDCHHLAELRNPSERGAGAMVEELVSYNDNATHTVLKDDANFSIRPSICFNRCTADYSFSKNGYIRVSCNLARNNHALYGKDAAADVSYRLKNLVLKYVSVPDDGQQQKMLMRSYVSVRSAIQSTDSHIQARVPSKACNAVSISFLKQSNESNNNSVDTYRLENFEQLEEINYMFNNSSSESVTYPITNYADAIKKGLESIEDSGHNQCNGNKLAGNKGTIFGLSFEEMLDLSNQRYSIQLKTANAGISTAPKSVFMFFHELLSL